MCTKRTVLLNCSWLLGLVKSLFKNIKCALLSLVSLLGISNPSASGPHTYTSQQQIYRFRFRFISLTALKFVNSQSILIVFIGFKSQIWLQIPFIHLWRLNLTIYSNAKSSYLANVCVSLFFLISGLSNSYLWSIIFNFYPSVLYIWDPVSKLKS